MSDTAEVNPIPKVPFAQQPAAFRQQEYVKVMCGFVLADEHAGFTLDNKVDWYLPHVVSADPDMRPRVRELVMQKIADGTHGWVFGG